MDIVNKVKKGVLLTGLALTLSGCATECNRAKSQGGYLISSKADYIVLKQSGGIITDVYKLRNVIVSSAENSDGWIFTDQEGNSINVGGDMKAIRMNNNNSNLWNRYTEYHIEFEEGKSYFDVAQKYLNRDSGSVRK
jgi:hypothetical protein